MPWLILFTCLLVGAQPRISAAGCAAAAADDGTGEPRTHMSPVTTFFATLTGVYGGYFGAGSGVMMVAVLGFGIDLRVADRQRPQDPGVLAANVVASVIFLVVADLDWAAVVLLAAGSVVGGYVGARIGSDLPETGSPGG